MAPLTRCGRIFRICRANSLPLPKRHRPCITNRSPPMSTSPLPPRRRLLRNAFATGAAFTSATLLAARSRTAQAAPGKMAETKGMKVGVIVETLSHPLIKYWGDECARQGAGFGMQVSVQDGERNVQKQTSEMEAF